MLKSKLATAAAALALSFGAIGSAQAVAIFSGAYKISLDNWDSGTTGYAGACSSVATCDTAAGIINAPGSVGSVNTSADTMGIFSVSLITKINPDGTETNVFTKGGAQGYLTGVFGNLQDWSVTPFGPVTVANSTGGTWSLYQNSTDWNPSLGPDVVAGSKDLNADMYPGITGGSLYLSGVFVSGVLAGDNTTTYSSTYNQTISGVGSGYMNITGGSAEAQYSTKGLKDQNGVMRDMYMTTSFDDADGKAKELGWTVNSTAQIKGNAVPEPGTMALAGLALLGAGLASRRRKS
ncbi:MAG TPA: PEP-CTERM sorting domain-containing protein [Alicycliphilus sp.]|nr:PEP-CTERM sorting domain-containing protein [Alicycliphilus sp.]